MSNNEFLYEVDRFENETRAAVEREQAVLEALADVLSEFEKLELNPMGRALIVRASRLCDVASGCNGEVHELLEGMAAVVECRESA